MKNRKILFITGAGSCKGYGYPTGKRLLEIITSDLLNHTKSVLEYEYNRKLTEMTVLPENDFFSSYNQFKEMCEEFISALKDVKDVNDSIDSFVARNKNEFKFIGTYSIALEMLLSEWRAKNGNFEKDLQGDKWLELLVCLAFQNYHITHLSKFQLNFEFLTFNYDRLIEVKLSHLISKLFRQASFEEIKKMINVKHVYGAIRPNVE